MRDEIDDLLLEYVKKFGEAMPLYEVSMTNEELKNTLLKCLESGKRYELPDEVKRLEENYKWNF